MRGIVALALAGAVLAAGPARAEAPTAEAVLDTYADIALAGYRDSLIAAQGLDAAIDLLIAAPSRATMARPMIQSLSSSERKSISSVNWVMRWR